MRFLAVVPALVACVIAPAAELVIPNLSPNGWEPGVDVGVIGGIDQYRPGGASQRTTLRNVVTEFSVDNTGATSIHTAINANISSLNNGEVLYFPYGDYRVTGSVTMAKKRVTVRGAGDGVKSTSSVTIGTGTKTFTVPAGLGWTAGVGIRVWHVNNRYKWMRGTVTSYSGTTLTLNITSTSGHTDTLAFWTVGQTTFHVENGTLAFYWTTSAPVAGTTAITSSPAVGDTSFTVADGSGLYLNNTLCKITRLRAADDEHYETGGYEREVRTSYNWITSVVGNTVTVAIPLLNGLPTGQTPRIAMSEVSDAVHSVGFEEFAMFGDGSDTSQGFLSFAGLYNSWAYRVQLGIAAGRHIQMQESVKCELAYCYIGESTTGSTTNTSVVQLGGVNCGLIRHCIVNWSMVTEGIPDHNNAILFNYGTGSGWSANHGGVSQYRLFEYNIVPNLHFDGFHGGYLKDTVHRNHLKGGADSLVDGYIILNRFGRNINSVGNVLGKTGSAQGIHSFGNPNMGSAINSGETADSALYISSSGASGARFRHFDTNGISLLTGTLTSKTASSATITLDAGTETDLTDPYFSGWSHVVWSSYTTRRQRMNINYGSSSGAVIVLDDDANVIGSALPDTGTAVWIHAGSGGAQELDGSVEGSAFNKKNYKYGVGGAAGSISDDTSDTLAHSLAYTAQPSDWPPSLTWPPPIHPSTPDIALTVIPAGYFYTNGEWPAAGSAVPTYAPGRLRMLRR